MSLVAPFLGHDVGLYTQGNYDGSSPVVPGDEMKFSVCACVCVCVCRTFDSCVNSCGSSRVVSRHDHNDPSQGS